MLLECDAEAVEAMVLDHISAHRSQPLREALRAYADRLGVPL